MPKKIQVNLDVKDKGSKQVKGFAKTTTNSFKKIENAAAKMNAGFSKITKGLKTMSVVIIAAAASAALLTKKVLDVADGIAKTADSLGIGTTALQEFRFAAKIAGVETSQLDMGLRFLVKSVGDAKIGTGTLTTALKGNNDALLAQLTSAKSVEEQFKIAMTAIRNTANAADKAALSMTLFGSRSGLALVNLAGGLEKSLALAKKYGIAIEEHLLRSAEGANDAITLLSAVIKQKLYSAVLTLAPKIQEVATSMSDWLTQHENVKKIEATFKKIGNAAKFVAENIGLITKAILILTGAWVAVKVIGIAGTIIGWGVAAAAAAKSAVAFNAVFGGVVKVAGELGRTVPFTTRAVSALGGAISFMLSPIGLVIIAITALIALIGYQFYKAVQESKAAMGDWSGVWDICIRKMKNAWEEFLHFFVTGLIYTLQGFEQMLDIMLYKPFEAFINLMISGINKLTAQLNKIPGVNISPLEHYSQTTLADLTQSNKMLEAEENRHFDRMYQIQEEFMRTPIGQAAAAKIIAPARPGEGGGGSFVPKTNGGGGAAKVIEDHTKAWSDWYAWKAQQERDATYGTKESISEALTMNKEYTDKLQQTYSGYYAWKAQQERDAIYGTKESLAEAAQMNEDFYAKIKEQAKVIKEKAAELTTQFVSVPLADMFTDWITGVDNFGQAFAKMAQAVGRDLIRMGTQALIFKYIMGMGGGDMSGSALGILSRSANGGILPGGFQKFAAGGIANKPTLGLIGEGSMNEAVVPLPNGKSIPVEMNGQGNQPTTVNVIINAVDAESFTKLTQRNPNAIIGPIISALQQGHNGLRGALATSAL